ncbi:MAG: signal peptidase II [Firmicutes bacterium]|nr:signal peptidase II [Bacillota bacterium]
MLLPYFGLTLLVLVTDQLLKAIVQAVMEPFQSVPVLKNIFAITYVRNYGAAFGVLPSQTWLLIALSLGVIIFVWVNRPKLRHHSLVFQIGLALALGGALGNLVDRVRLGYVIDFLDFHFWPVFNLADTAIVIGVGLIIIGLYHAENRERNKESAPDQACGPAGKEEL